MIIYRLQGKFGQVRAFFCDCRHRLITVHACKGRNCVVAKDIVTKQEIASGLHHICGKKNEERKSCRLEGGEDGKWFDYSLDGVNMGADLKPL